jgi:hypothetical protein
MRVRFKLRLKPMSGLLSLRLQGSVRISDELSQLSRSTSLNKSYPCNHSGHLARAQVAYECVVNDLEEESWAPDCWETFLGDDNKPHEGLAGGLRYTTRQMILDGGYELASLASRFAGRDTNELASIRSTVDTQTRWLLSKRPLRPCAL